ncbi:MAG: hypothetical protein KTR25_16295 [Myxococcales bacterium]|nr:hypothetical protein [Myxococcales bacterium]
MTSHQRIAYVLRIAVTAEFFGHGMWAILQNPSWIPYVTLFGWSAEHAPIILTLVGVLDVLLALSVLIRPHRWPLTWMTTWALFTAALRPLAGGSWLDFIERGANIGAPLALLLLIQEPPRSTHS